MINYQRHIVAATRRAHVRRPLGRRVGAVAALTVLATMSACGGSDQSKAEIASVEEPSSNTTGVSRDGEAGDSTAAATASEGSERSNEEIEADFTNCMADEGVDLPAPEDGGGNVVDGGYDMVIDPDSIDPDVLEAASEKCEPILDELQNQYDFSPEEEAAIIEFNRQVENCMAEKGFELPSGDDGGNEVEAGDASPTTLAEIDWDAYSAAGDECEEEIGMPDILDDIEDDS